VTARERESIDGGATVKAMLLLIEPAPGRQAMNKAVYRALGRVQDAHELRECGGS
jgi:hypothetical protein